MKSGNSSTHVEKSACALVLGMRSQLFFSARVSEAHVIGKLREISDKVSKGELNVAEARGILKNFLVGQGKDVEKNDGTKLPPGVRSIKNIGSTARLNLILEQNRLMANAAATYAEGMDPDVMEQWPYWRYRCVNDSRSRERHKAIDGKIFKKTDPIWETIFPPNGFNCRCWVEDVSEEELGGAKISTSRDVEKDINHISSDGFQFNPNAKNLTSFDSVDAFKSDKKRYMEMIVDKINQRKGDIELKFGALNAPFELPNDAKTTIDEVARLIANNNGKITDEIVEKFPEKKLFISKIPKNIIEIFKIDESESSVFFDSPGSFKQGIRHWIKNHADTLKSETVTDILQRTLCNPNAIISGDFKNGKLSKIFFAETLDGTEVPVLTLNKTARGWDFTIVSGFYSDGKYINATMRNNNEKKQ